MRRWNRLLILGASLTVMTGACGDDDPAFEESGSSSTEEQPAATTAVTLVYAVAEGIELHVYVDDDDFSYIVRPGTIWQAVVDGEAFSCGVDWEECTPTDEPLALALRDQVEGFTEPLSSTLIAAEVGKPVGESTTAGTIAGVAVTCTAMEGGEVCVLDDSGYLARLTITADPGNMQELLRVDVGRSTGALPEV